MNHDDTDAFDRRQMLTFAALSGLLAVPSLAEAADTNPPTQAKDGKVKPKDVSNPLLCEPHVCRGLNTCKGKGRDRQNQCAGMGACATAPDNSCGGQNQCRGLGACDQPPQAGYPGENTCKGKGGCEVPLLPKKAEIWKKARFRFEVLMEDMGKKVGMSDELKKWLNK